MTANLPESAVPLVVIPCLNEIDHIEALVRQMAKQTEAFGGSVVVADGGSEDGSIAAVAELSRELTGVHLIDNPRQIQSAGINTAVAAFGAGHSHLIRVDAHSSYPDDFILRLLEEAERTDAASVVVGMVAEGRTAFEKVSALAQNSRVGNGGSKHRNAASGEFVDHGHHALMRLDAFNEVHGYDPTFTHNEDAELDHRLRAAGHEIWLTGQTEIVYYPRSTAAGLARQYFNYGRGRARNVYKHGTVPKLRQLIMASVLPVVLLALLAPISGWFAVPALAWAFASIAAGFSQAVAARDLLTVATGPLSMLMHLSWSAGFWRGLMGARPVPTPEVSA
ncbi:glycosyltransferase family 2 protein [Pseudoruegeria sp. HB172150]|uniref:glycosyltransferase family 2 protein n=1 Tax=Pseudoruegeria sp. HB172150 TaxID=2721164 RepID=UPI001555C83F